MNLLKGTIRLDGKPSFVARRRRQSAACVRAAGSDGRPAIYGIRPEHLTLERLRWHAGRGVGAGADRVETQVFAKVGTQKIVAVFRQRHDGEARRDACRMTPEVGLAHLFDEESGARIA